MTATFDPCFDVSGKHVVIAGAAGGIGSEIALEMHRRQAQLTLIDHDQSRLKRFLSQHQLDSATMVADITDEPAIISCFDRISGNGAAPEVVINAAGLLPIRSALEQDIAEFRQCLDTNLTGALILSRAAARSSIASGRNELSIVHISSVSSSVANTQYAAYASSKAALSQLVRVLAREWAEDNILVNAVGPALIETPLTAGYLQSDTFRQNAVASIPLGRLATVNDILPTVLLLCSAGGRFITGQTIHVDGGRTLV